MRDLVTLDDVDRHADTDDDTPRALLGLDEADRPVWWTPATHGNAWFISAAGDVPPWTGVLGLAGLGASTARRLVGGDAVPAMSSHPHGRWALHTDDTGWTTVQGVHTTAPHPAER